MMVVVLWIPLHWAADVLEATGAIATILVVGALIAVGAFWLLYRAVSKLAGPSLEWEEPAGEESEWGAEPPEPPRDANLLN